MFLFCLVFAMSLCASVYLRFVVTMLLTHITNVLTRAALGAVAYRKRFS